MQRVENQLAIGPSDYAESTSSCFPLGLALFIIQQMKFTHLQCHGEHSPELSGWHSAASLIKPDLLLPGVFKPCLAMLKMMGGLKLKIAQSLLYVTTAF